MPALLHAFLGLKPEDLHPPETIPLQVLREIAEVGGLTPDEVENPQVAHLLPDRDFALLLSVPVQREECTAFLCRMLNPQVDWSSRTCAEASNHAIQLERLALDGIRGTWPWLASLPLGLPTPQTTKTLPFRILYRWCRMVGIPTTWDQTASEMFASLDLWARNSDLALRHQLASLILSTPSVAIGDVVSLLFQIQPTQDKPATATAQFQIHQSQLLEEVAQLFGFDLSQSSYPMLEAFYIQSLWQSRGLPDPRLFTPIRRRYQLIREVYTQARDPALPRNLALFDLTQTFNPDRPESWYSEEHMIEMARHEGFTPDELMDEPAYHLLQQASLEAGFFLANRIPDHELPPNTTIFLEDVANIDRNRAVVFGNRGSKLDLYTMDELAQLFRQQGNLANPSDPEHLSFPLRAIRKLQILAEASGEYELIRVLDVLQRAPHQDPSVSFLLRQSLDVGWRPMLEQCVRLVLDAGMYMRAWDGKQEMALNVMFPVENQEEIDVRVANSLATLRERVAELGEEASQHFWNLPLFRYSGREFRRSTHTEDGKTLGERIAIVVQRPDLISACIRLSSNWLIASACRYAQEFGVRLPVQIDDLEHTA